MRMLLAMMLPCHDYLIRLYAAPVTHAARHAFGGAMNIITDCAQRAEW